MLFCMDKSYMTSYSKLFAHMETLLVVSVQCLLKTGESFEGENVNDEV